MSDTTHSPGTGDSYVVVDAVTRRLCSCDGGPFDTNARHRSGCIGGHAEQVIRTLRSRSVADRMEAMGMVEAPGHWVETPRSAHARCWREPIAVIVTEAVHG